MDKWVCEVCGYVYDPAVGDDEGAIPQELLLKICPMIGPAQYVARAKMTLSRPKSHS